MAQQVSREFTVDAVISWMQSYQLSTQEAEVDVHQPCILESKDTCLVDRIVRFNGQTKMQHFKLWLDDTPDANLHCDMLCEELL